jgi:hypothetical protein
MQVKISLETSIRVSKEVHGELVAHLEGTERKIGKFTEIAIKEKIIKEKNIKK